MARRGRGRPRKKNLTIKSDETQNFIGILSLMIAILLLISYFVDSPGFDWFRKGFGQATIVAFLLFTNLSLKMFGIDYLLTRTCSIFGQLLLLFSSAGLLHYSLTTDNAELAAKLGNNGGIVGYYTTHICLIDIFATQGALIILVFCVLISICLTLQISIKQIIAFIKKTNEAGKEMLNSMNKKMKEDNIDSEEELPDDKVEKEKMLGDFRKQRDLKEESPAVPGTKEKSDTEKSSPAKTSQGKIKITDELLEGALINTSLNYPNWKLPPTSLLALPAKIRRNDEDIRKNADIIEQTLESFGIKAKVVDAMCGPAVTQYALNIALGTKVAKIANLKTDLALALAAPTGATRIEAISKSNYIGLEVPNTQRSTVYLKELVEDERIKEIGAGIPFCFGKKIDGTNIISDLRKMPHLLVAGATGSGKSVLLNSFIISLLMHKTPDEIRMIMVDPKQVELADYDGIPHLLTPVITDMEKVLNSLKWAIVEMEKRYTILRHAHVRNISEYNKKLGFSAMPYILIFVDEMADLMLSSGAETETAVVKLAQKARATGIHLVLATQRPSVNVITGLIKANIPGRIGLGVATQIDSRVILDRIGAETLLGDGDMLFKQPDRVQLCRLQGAWVSQKEVRKVVKFVRNQAKETQYSAEVTKKQVEPGASTSAIESAVFSEDEYFVDAVRIVCNAKKGSASLLQRKLSIGYNRAARLLDELQNLGVVGPQEDNKPRKILVSDPEEFLQKSKKQQTE